MEVSLHARGLWAAIEGEEDLKEEYGYHNDKGALELIGASGAPTSAEEAQNRAGDVVHSHDVCWLGEAA
jgi:hypothetical protein